MKAIRFKSVNSISISLSILDVSVRELLYFIFEAGSVVFN